MKYLLPFLLLACQPSENKAIPEPPPPVATPTPPPPPPASPPEDPSLPFDHCSVHVCNKLERFSLSVWKHMKDAMGETCFDATVHTSEAHPGKALSSESRWYQGRSINVTKKSVTRVSKVYACNTKPPTP